MRRQYESWNTFFNIWLEWVSVYKVVNYWVKNLHVCMNYYSFKFCIYTSSYIQVHGIVAHIYPLELMQFMYKYILFTDVLLS